MVTANEMIKEIQLEIPVLVDTVHSHFFVIVDGILKLVGMPKETWYNRPNWMFGCSFRWQEGLCYPLNIIMKCLIALEIDNRLQSTKNLVFNDKKFSRFNSRLIYEVAIIALNG